MDEKTRKEIALFRYGILAPLISGTYDENKSIKQFFRDAAGKVYQTPNGEDIKIAAATLERWYYNYKNKGFEALMPVRRCDTGRFRKLDSDIKEQIKYLKQEYPRIPATLIYQKLINNGTIIKGDISLSTINRYINQLKLDNKYSNNKDMKRY